MNNVLEKNDSPGRTTGRSRLAALGVYGFDEFEPLILAALVTEDPLLLIGSCGTGKTFLLNTLSEALALEHRHYNASMISFDDLVGFPYPDQDKGGIRFLETPATVWNAQSVLIDEISRCKPEHQNRLFSLVNERRIQGIALKELRYRWAAMNPCSSDQNVLDSYTGSEALDQALADRFALFINASDWDSLRDDERRSIADPLGDGKMADDGGALAREVAAWRTEYERLLASCPEDIMVYASAAISALNTAQIRMSPRRSRFLTKSLLAAQIVTGGRNESIYRLVLTASIPHPCWGVSPDKASVAAAHRLAWDAAHASARLWMNLFLAETQLKRKLELFVTKCNSPDEGTEAIDMLLVSAPPERAAAFAYALYPSAVAGKLPIGTEGVNDIGKWAMPYLHAEGTIRWQVQSGARSQHPDFARYAAVLNKLSGARAERAQQFFNGCLTNNCIVADPASLEEEIEQCVSYIKDKGLV